MTTSERMEHFKADVADMKLKTGTADRDSLYQGIGVVLMVAGVVIALITYSASLNQDDLRDVVSSGMLVTVMVGLALLGAAIFVRYSMSKFLRLWLLRQLYEHQANTDRIVEAVTRKN
jgi:hypothetical protein